MGDPVSLAVGSAFLGPTASGAAMAGGTAGLFGSAGAFSLGTTLSTLSTAASLFSGVGGFFGSRAEGADTAAAMEFQRRQAENQARDEYISGLQQENERRRELNESLSTLNSIRAARGLTRSPTGDAIRRNIGNIGGANIRALTYNRLSRTSSLKSEADYYKRASKGATKAGNIGGAISLLDRNRLHRRQDRKVIHG